MRSSVVYVPKCQRATCEKRANFSCLCANVSTCQYMCQRVSVPKSCLLLAFQFFNCSCQKAYQFFNYFSKESFNFWIFQICLTFANFKNIWAVLETSSRETKNLNFDFCKIPLRKNLINLKPLTSFPMEYVGLTERLFGWCIMELNIVFYLPNFIRRV